MNKKISTKKGFTIIEVVLVLAIAGLIFLMVFVALPALQRSQRDTQRRSDMSRLATAITNWQANHNGNLPSVGSSDTNNTDAKTLLNDYLNGDEGEFSDPSANNYVVNIVANTTTTAADRPTVNVVRGAVCDGESVTTTNATAGNYAIIYRLEGAGTYCLDNK